jgi:3-deoxy-D-manno-octulosonic-acid transferase
MAHIMQFIYSLLLYLALPFLFIRLYLKGEKNVGYRKHWAERLGHIPHMPAHCIWVHAVSFGESVVATPLIKALLAHYPDTPILITNTTPTGREHIQRTFGEQVHQAYLPFDTPTFVNRFLDTIQPKALLLLETELWPNVLSLCQARGIPCLLMNARLSERSFKRYGQAANASKKMMQALTHIAVQTETEAARFITLGATADKTTITGSIKFDISLPTPDKKVLAILQKSIGTRPVITAASTHKGEETQLLEAFKTVLKTVPDALLVLVPRHTNRVDEIKKLIATQRLTLAQRSKNEPVTASTNIYLGDTMGEMGLYFTICNIAFVGGSLVNTGGHNVLEPASIAKPVLFGPHMHNFLEISKSLLAAQGAVKVRDASHLAKAISHLIEDKTARLEMGTCAKDLVEQNRGALDKSVAIIQNHIKLM